MRISFAVEEPICYTSVRDMERMWERLFRRAELPITYSQGFNPHPRMQLASALPVGYHSDEELIDVFLAKPIDVRDALDSIKTQAPTGLEVVSAQLVPVKAKPLQALMRKAYYAVDVDLFQSQEEAQSALDALLANPSIIRQRIKKKGKKVNYDMRPLIHQIEHTGSTDGRHHLIMELRCGSQGSGRPEEIISELGWADSDYVIRRTRLVWEGREE